MRRRRRRRGVNEWYNRVDVIGWFNRTETEAPRPACALWCGLRYVIADRISALFVDADVVSSSAWAFILGSLVVH